MTWLLYPQGRNSQNPFTRRLGGLQSQTGHSGKEKKIPVPVGNRTAVIQPVGLSLY